MSWVTFGTVVAQVLIALVLLFIASAAASAVIDGLRGKRPANPDAPVQCPCCGRKHAPMRSDPR